MAALKLSNKHKRELIALAEKALAQAGKGQFALAMRICDQADRQHKDLLEVMYARGMIASMQLDHATAVHWLGRACQAAPKRALFLINYASCLLYNNQEDKAAEIYPKILAQAPHLFEKANGYAAYGSALDAIGEFRHSIKLFEQGLVQEPCNVLLLKKAACIYSQVLETDAAMALIEKAHASAPNDPVVLHDMAVYLMQQGKLDEARIRLRQAITLKPDYIEALAVLINSGDYEQREQDLLSLKKLYTQEEPGSERRINAAFVLGKNADKQGNHKLAFDYWTEANCQRRQRITYHEEEQRDLHKVAAEAFPSSRFAGEGEMADSDTAPVFIIGMPRCGSTLLEHALSRHPDLTASGEMDAMQQAIVGRSQKVSNTKLIEKLASASDPDLVEVGKEYNRRLTQEYGLNGRIIDKTLNNYLYAGLIAKAIPNAHIIHVRREPIASCLSMFQENFAGASIPYSFELDELGRQYVRYQKLMQHWREVLPKEILLEVSYEQLVGNTEVELRRLLEGCHLEWHKECLASHKSTASVATASMFQVRKPIHQNSVARWKHYEEQLAPLRQYLQP